VRWMAGTCPYEATTPQPMSPRRIIDDTYLSCGSLGYVIGQMEMGRQGGVNFGGGTVIGKIWSLLSIRVVGFTAEQNGCPHHERRLCGLRHSSC
jgi:hypothetical protein